VTNGGTTSFSRRALLLGVSFENIKFCVSVIKSIRIYMFFRKVNLCKKKVSLSGLTGNQRKVCSSYRTNGYWVIHLQRLQNGYIRMTV
jgi:hypothetical protein